MHRRTFLGAVAGAILTPPLFAREPEPVTVEIDTSDVPALRDWAEAARKLIIEWHPRIENLLSSPGHVTPKKVRLKIRKTDEGVAATAGGRIMVASHWIEKHPEDIGLIVHELTHIHQSYPDPNPGWITEGVADYIRWVVYEAKPLDWFTAPAKPQGYRESYRTAAGFMLWLETEPAPGIVRKLNTAMRTKTFDAKIFEKETGKSLDELWDDYVKARKEG